MDTAALAALVLSVITGIASGVGNGLGAAAGEQVNRLARERLGADEGSRRLLERFDGDPAGAEEDLHARLRAMIEQDPEFADRLRSAIGAPASPAGPTGVAALVPPRPQRPPVIHNTGVLIDGGARAKGHFAGRDMVVNKIRNTSNGSLAVAAIALVVVLALALWGGTSLVTGGDGPSGPGRGVAVLRDPRQAGAVLPDLANMPSGWSQRKAAAQLVDQDNLGYLCPGTCQDMLSVWSVSFYDPSSGQRVDFAVTSWPSAEQADSHFGPADLTTKVELAMPEVGDRSTASAVDTYRVVATVRVGTTLLYVDERAGGKYDMALLERMARLIADRSQALQDRQAA